MTGYAICGDCGSTQRKLGVVDTASVRKRRREADALATTRRKDLLVAVSVFLSLCGCAHFGFPIVRLWLVAKEPLTPIAMTLADDMRNRDIHAARRALHLE